MEPRTYPQDEVKFIAFSDVANEFPFELCYVHFSEVFIVMTSIIGLTTYRDHISDHMVV